MQGAARQCLRHWRSRLPSPVLETCAAVLMPFGTVTFCKIACRLVGYERHDDALDDARTCWGHALQGGRRGMEGKESSRQDS